jgi:hypothetical protein
MNRPSEVVKSRSPGGHGGDGDVGDFQQVDEVLQFPGAAVQAVGMPGDDVIDRAGLDVVQQAVVLGAGLAGEGAAVVVLVNRLDDLPALAGA